jgi:acyl-CoA dehydrogenase
MRLALAQAARLSGAHSLEGYEEIVSDLSGPVLENAARFAGDVLSPLNSVGDRSPSRLGPEGVITPPGFVSAYRRFCADGWVSLGAPAEYGGQGLPALLAAATAEMWAGANMAFAMCTELAVGATEALRTHATTQLRDSYLPRIVTGEWAATMCLTEPQAGSDLSTLRTRAEPDGDAWRLFGRKIYISWGDHDLTDNIVHFVLARTPDAPAGLKGISLFIVPKMLMRGDGTPQPNDIAAVSLEHKMGIHASPTCVMAIGEHSGARGWLVGRLHEGLACMFTIMNHMRIGVGLHSLGLAERALQLARHHARERLQGRNSAGQQRPIIEHPDVRRMLLLMKSLTQAARGLVYTAAATVDVAQREQDAARRAAAARRADLLTPVVKAWVSELAVEVASLGVQVHGGTGYINEAEISQVYRDARIGPIFEGTNYMQAQDLLGRKIVRDRGAALGELLGDIEQAANQLPAGPTHPAAGLRAGLLHECRRMREAAAQIIAKSAADPELIGAVACDFLTWLGILAGGWQWAAAAALTAGDSGESSGARAVLETAAFYGSHVLPRAEALAAVVRHGSVPVTATPIADI